VTGVERRDARLDEARPGRDGITLGVEEEPLRLEPAVLRRREAAPGRLDAGPFLEAAALSSSDTSS
jgi:hypothetical protein